MTSAPRRVVRRPVQLHPVQSAFRHSPALYRAFVGGRGAGKTWIGAFDLMVRSRKGCHYLIASPDYTMLHDTTLPSFTALARELGLWASIKVTPHPVVQLTTGAEVRFRSADNPDKLRGPNLSGCWLDEASLMDQAARDVVIAALREGGQQGWMSATFTPAGITHWTYKLWGPQPDGKLAANTETFHAETGANPFNPPGFMEQLAQQYVGIYAEQELYGRFVAMEGAEFDPRWFHAGIWFEKWPPCQVRVMALDPSMGKIDKPGDYSAFILLGLTKDGTLYCDADLDRRHSPAMVERGVQLLKEFKPQAFAVESNQFQRLLISEFIRVGKRAGLVNIPMYGLDNFVPKVERIRSIAPLIAQGRIKFKAGSAGAELLVQQLRDWPAGRYDDGPDAVEQAVRMMMTMMGQSIQGAKPKAMEG